MHEEIIEYSIVTLWMMVETSGGYLPLVTEP